jgi:NAD(P)-dependent dehydrogenase (short-subunit alcohol dehydrogenase family)
MDLNLKGRRALVTGSTAGIGLAIATSLAQEGARVIVTGRTQAGVTKAVDDVRAATGGDVVGFAGDLGTAAAADANSFGSIGLRLRYVQVLQHNFSDDETLLGRQRGVCPIAGVVVCAWT